MAEGAEGAMRDVIDKLNNYAEERPTYAPTGGPFDLEPTPQSGYSGSLRTVRPRVQSRPRLEVLVPNRLTDKKLMQLFAILEEGVSSNE